MKAVQIFLTAVFLMSASVCAGTETAAVQDPAPVVQSSQPVAAPAAPGNIENKKPEASKEDEARSLIIRGLAMIQHGRFKTAEDSFNQVIQLVPDSYFARIYLGSVKLKLKEYLNAIKYYNEAKKIDPKKANAYDGLMEVYETLAVYPNAIKVGEEGLENGVDPLDMNSYLGWLHYLYGDMKKAEEADKKALALKDKEVSVMNNLGLVYFTMGRYQDALDLFNKARSLNSAGQMAPFFASLAYNRLDKFDDAVKAMQEAKDRDPRFTWDKALGYAGTYYPHGDPGRIEPILKKIGLTEPKIEQPEQPEQAPAPAQKADDKTDAKPEVTPDKADKKAE
ncbi:MAG TPA: tetratricopeptide repeat protein [Nitrospirota bacterium]|jgi:tetratricopeptide (TPR) repeat protein